MINLNLILVMGRQSFVKMLRSKSENITSLLEFLIIIPLILFIVSTGIVGNDFLLRAAVLLLFLNTITLASSVGMSIIIKRKEGVYREILSSPSSNLSIFIGLVIGNVIFLFFRNAILLLIMEIFGIGLDFFTFFLLLFATVAISPVILLIAIIVSSKIENVRMLTVSATIFTVSQFILSGILVSFNELRWIVLNPLAFPADLLLFVAGVETNFPLFIDVLSTLFLFVIGYILANFYFSRIEC